MNKYLQMLGTTVTDSLSGAHGRVVGVHVNARGTVQLEIQPFATQAEPWTKPTFWVMAEFARLQTDITATPLHEGVQALMT